MIKEKTLDDYARDRLLSIAKEIRAEAEALEKDAEILHRTVDLMLGVDTPSSPKDNEPTIKGFSEGRVNDIGE